MKTVTKQIVSLFSFQECVTVLAFKDDGVYELLGEYLEKEHTEFDFHHVNARIVEEQAELLETIAQIRAASQDDHSRQIVIIEDLDKTPNPAELVTAVDAMYNQMREHISILYVLEDAAITLDLQGQLDSSSTFYENIVLMPLETTDEQHMLENHCQQRYQVELPAKDLKSIFNDTSGHYELYKRTYKAHATKNFRSLDSYIQRLVRGLGADTLTVMRKMLKGVELTETDQQLIQIYVDLGFVNKEFTDITIPMLREPIIQYAPAIGDDETIQQELMSHMHHFTKKELQILQYLIERPDELVTKEELGDVVWGKHADEKYSPWAIDQLIFRVRTKVDKLKLNLTIRTQHGRGYICEVGR